MSLSGGRQVRFSTGFSIRNYRTLYICLSAPRSTSLPCPPNYEWSLIVADSSRSGHQMTQHCLVPRPHDNTPHQPQPTKPHRPKPPSPERTYRELPLDYAISRYNHIVALINMRKAYKIDDEEAFARIIQDVDVPPRSAAPDTWARNCVWHLARTGKISQVEERDWADDIWVEMAWRGVRFAALVAADHRPEFGSSGKARRGRREGLGVLPALVFRDGRMAPVPPEQREKDQLGTGIYRSSARLSI